MAKAGDTIESPLSGARILFLKTARDTNGQLLQLDAKEAFPLTRFADVGAIVYLLKAIPWQVADFSVDRYFDRLKELERHARTEGCITLRKHRFLLDATKPT